MKNSEVVLIDNFVEKGAESIFCRIFLNLTLHDFDGLDSKLLDTSTWYCSFTVSQYCMLENLNSISAKTLKIPIIQSTMPNSFPISELSNFDLVKTVFSTMIPFLFGFITEDKKKERHRSISPCRRNWTHSSDASKATPNWKVARLRKL